MISYKITKQGAPIVEGMSVVYKSRKVIVINIMMQSKYCDVGYYGSEGGCPMIGIEAKNDKALYLHPDHVRYDDTEILITGIESSSNFIVLCTGGGRYDIPLCLVNLEKCRM